MPTEITGWKWWETPNSRWRRVARRNASETRLILLSPLVIERHQPRIPKYFKSLPAQWSDQNGGHSPDSQRTAVWSLSWRVEPPWGRSAHSGRPGPPGWPSQPVSRPGPPGLPWACARGTRGRRGSCRTGAGNRGIPPSWSSPVEWMRFNGNIFPATHDGSPLLRVSMELSYTTELFLIEHAEQNSSMYYLRFEIK